MRLRLASTPVAGQADHQVCRYPHICLSCPPVPIPYPSGFLMMWAASSFTRGYVHGPACKRIMPMRPCSFCGRRQQVLGTHCCK